MWLSGVCSRVRETEGVAEWCMFTCEGDRGMEKPQAFISCSAGKAYHIILHKWGQTHTPSVKPVPKVIFILHHAYDVI